MSNLYIKRKKQKIKKLTKKRKIKHKKEKYLQMKKNMKLQILKVKFLKKIQMREESNLMQFQKL